MFASEIAESAKTRLSWTGDIVNLVELMFGLQEMQCLNDGKLPIEKLGNRTYFLIKMWNVLEERIDQAIHISLRREKTVHTYYIIF